MDDEWKERIRFALYICMHAAMPLRCIADRETAFRFVRAELISRNVHPTDDAIVEQQVAYIHEVFDEACGNDDE